MTKIKVKRLRKVGNRYFWNPSKAMKLLGFKSAPLGKDLGKAIEHAIDMNRKAAAQLDLTEANPSQVPQMGMLPGSMAALIKLYQSSPEFTECAPRTRLTYMYVQREIETKAGHILVTDITRQSLKKLYRKTLPRGVRAAKALLQQYSILLSFAEDEGWIKIGTHPARKMRLRGSDDRTQKWTIDQLNMFIDTAYKMGDRYAGVARILMLAYASASRLVDMRHMPWSALGPDNILRYTPSKTKRKTGVALSIEMPQWLLKQMDTWPRQGPLMVYDTGYVSGLVPYTQDMLGKLGKEIREAAGLPAELQLRDSRRTALTESGDGGATVTQLQALGGHKTLSMLSVYVVPTAAASNSAQAARGHVKPKGRS